MFLVLGLPAGVVNMVHGTGPTTGEAIINHPDIALLSFTGSTPVGKRIMEMSAKHLRKVSLEVRDYTFISPSITLFFCQLLMVKGSWPGTVPGSCVILGSPDLAGPHS